MVTGPGDSKPEGSVVEVAKFAGEALGAVGSKYWVVSAAGSGGGESWAQSGALTVRARMMRNWAEAMMDGV